MNLTRNMRWLSRIFYWEHEESIRDQRSNDSCLANNRTVHLVSWFPFTVNHSEELTNVSAIWKHTYLIYITPNFSYNLTFSKNFNRHPGYSQLLGKSTFITFICDIRRRKCMEVISCWKWDVQTLAFIKRQHFNSFYGMHTQLRTTSS